MTPTPRASARAVPDLVIHVQEEGGQLPDSERNVHKAAPGAARRSPAYPAMSEPLAPTRARASSTVSLSSLMKTAVALMSLGSAEGAAHDASTLTTVVSMLRTQGVNDFYIGHNGDKGNIEITVSTLLGAGVAEGTQVDYLTHLFYYSDENQVVDAFASKDPEVVERILELTQHGHNHEEELRQEFRNLMGMESLSMKLLSLLPDTRHGADQLRQVHPGSRVANMDLRVAAAPPMDPGVMDRLWAAIDPMWLIPDAMRSEPEHDDAEGTYRGLFQDASSVPRKQQGAALIASVEALANVSPESPQKFVQHFYDAGFAQLLVPFADGVRAIVVAPRKTLPHLRARVKELNAMGVSLIDPKLSIRPELSSGNLVGAWFMFAGTTAISGILAWHVCSMLKDKAAKPEAPPAPRIEEAPRPRTSAARVSRGRNPSDKSPAGGNEDLALPPVSHQAPSAAQQNRPEVYRQTNPKEIARTVQQRIEDKPRAEAIKIVGEVVLELEAAMQADDGSRVAEAVGMLHGIFLGLKFNENAIRSIFRELDISFDYDYFVEAVSQAMSNGATSDLRAANKLLEEDRRIARHVMLIEQLADPRGMLGPREQPIAPRQARAPIPRVRAHAAGPAERHAGVDTAAAFQLAKAMAGQATPGAKAHRAAVWFGHDVYIPTANRWPHIHVTKDFVSFKKDRGDHYQLTEGDVLQAARIQRARGALDVNAPAQAAMATFLDFLVESGSAT